MINIDGSRGEGGGQILRSSLALALITGQAFRTATIRAGRRKPGLMRQHLTAVRAAQEISGADCEGAELNSQSLVFRPGTVRPGDYSFAVGTAGSAMLVLQTVLIPLALTGGVSTVTVEGGTHAAWAPCFDHFQSSFLPLLERMGIRVQAQILRHGFYPAGGGLVQVSIGPAQERHGLELLERGGVVRQSARALYANIRRSVAMTECETLLGHLPWDEDQIQPLHVGDSRGPGNAIVVKLEHTQVTEVVTAVGEKGLRAERIAQRAAAEVQRYMGATAPVGAHLADQLLLPMAFLGGGVFRAQSISEHTFTNAGVLERFLGDVVSIETEETDALVRVKSCPTP